MEKQTDTILLERLKELKEPFKQDVHQTIATIEKNREIIALNQELYFNHKKDERDRKHYYRSLSNKKTYLFSSYHELLKKTHKQKLPYFISKDQYLYSWVDMHPDGTIKSIYSGLNQDPKKLLQEDFLTIQKKYWKFQELLETPKDVSALRHEKIPKIDYELKFNTEHIVPQSWYGAEDPMKGDLHHLFACQPECNIKRSNFPYDDFSFYIPESPQEKIKNQCGVTMNNRFEPEYGKGTVARAIMYFLVRYPRAIKKSFLRTIDISLMIRWHQQFEVTAYEKHRNQAIYTIQGNRNPFIDFPELAESMNFQITASKHKRM
ncbi:endonuclease I family protein [Bacillus tuaregi]|uniref:endonuclease I family protein n=1 Tax=Bacillus tuaregi TaxID=1816695 RepID=UPI000A017F62|nr:endonuclease [Bacillus tuaregi]